MASDAAASRALARDAQVTPAAIIRFFVPLSAVFMTYAIVFNVINSAMARSVDAALALSAFAIGQGIADLISVPAGSGNQWLLARGRDKKSFKAGLRVMMQIAVVVSVLLAVAASTPLGKIIYGNFYRAPVEMHPGIRSMLYVCMPLPLIFILRGASQSVLMLQRKTHLMTAGVFVRLLFVAIMSLVLRGRIDGTLLGGLLWISGMSIEGLSNFIVARKLFRSYPDEPTEGAIPGAPQIWKFLLPLIATSFLWSLGGPVLNGGMARTVNPKQSIAVYQLVSNAAWLLLAFARDGYRQVVLVFWNDQKSLRVVETFARWLALSISALMATAALTGTATWFLRSVVGASPELIAPARNVLYIVSLMPVALVLIELNVGKLLRTGRTTPIGIAKGANIVAMFSTATFIAAVAPSAGPMLGALAMLAGTVTEILVLYPAVRNLPREPERA